MRKRQARLRLCMGLLVISVWAGCRPPSEFAPVSGVVALDGEPLDGGTVFFYPTAGRPATADIQSDGTYVLQTYVEGDGAMPGMHRVTVVPQFPGGLPGFDSTAPPFRSSIPQVYGDRRTTPLSAEVAAGPNVVPLDLKSGN